MCFVCFLFFSICFLFVNMFYSSVLSICLRIFLRREKISPRVNKWNEERDKMTKAASLPLALACLFPFRDLTPIRLPIAAVGMVARTLSLIPQTREKSPTPFNLVTHLWHTLMQFSNTTTRQYLQFAFGFVTCSTDTWWQSYIDWRNVSLGLRELCVSLECSVL